MLRGVREVAKNPIIKPSEHVFIAGATGTGKTYLARKYLAQYEYVVAIDTKGMLQWPEVPKDEKIVVTKLTDLDKAGEKYSKIIYRPRFEELNFEYYNSFFRWVYERKNTICWVDEVMSICPNPHKIPDYYKAILTRGRERKTAAWSLTQRPSGIPAVIMSESTHLFIFRLNLPADRDKLSYITGSEKLEERPDLLPGGGKDKYAFWYWQPENDEPIRAKLIEKRRN